MKKYRVSLAIKAISAAIARDMPTGNGIDIITVTDKGVNEIINKPVETRVIA